MNGNGQGSNPGGFLEPFVGPHGASVFLRPGPLINNSAGPVVNYD